MLTLVQKFTKQKDKLDLKRNNDYMQKKKPENVQKTVTKISQM